MNAIIYDGKTTYPSTIFAIKNRGWNTEVVAFDADYAAVKRIHMWRPFRRVFIVEWTDFAHERGKWQGLDWVLQDRKLQNALRLRESVPITAFPQFQEYARKPQLPEWFEIQNQEDITSLMVVAMNFHDAQPLQAERTGNDLEVLFDTTWGCYITVRFMDMIEADLINRVGLILDSEMRFEADGIRWDVTGGWAGWTHGVDYDKPFGEPYVRCKKILWKIEVEKKGYRICHMDYANLAELCDDLSRQIPDARLENDRIIVTHGVDRLEIAMAPGGFVTWLNGQQEKGICEDQDIYGYALDFVFPETPVPEEPILWQFSPSRFRTFCHSLKYASICPAAWLLLGLILALTGNIFWKGFFILFGGTAAVTYLVFAITMSRLERMEYIITETNIRIHYPAIICTATYADITDIRLCRSIFNKNVGTIKFKVKKGFNANYQFAKIDDVDSVYNLLLPLWEKKQ